MKKSTYHAKSEQTPVARLAVHAVDIALRRAVRMIERYDEDLPEKELLPAKLRSQIDFMGESMTTDHMLERFSNEIYAFKQELVPMITDANSMETACRNFADRQLGLLFLQTNDMVLARMSRDFLRDVAEEAAGTMPPGDPARVALQACVDYFDLGIETYEMMSRLIFIRTNGTHKSLLRLMQEENKITLDPVHKKNCMGNEALAKLAKHYIDEECSAMGMKVPEGKNRAMNPLVMYYLYMGTMVAKAELINEGVIEDESRDEKAIKAVAERTSDIMTDIIAAQSGHALVGEVWGAQELKRRLQAAGGVMPAYEYSLSDAIHVAGHAGYDAFKAYRKHDVSVPTHSDETKQGAGYETPKNPVLREALGIQDAPATRMRKMINDAAAQIGSCREGDDFVELTQDMAMSTAEAMITQYLSPSQLEGTRAMMVALREYIAAHRGEFAQVSDVHLAAMEQTERLYPLIEASLFTARQWQQMDSIIHYPAKDNQKEEIGIGYDSYHIEAIHSLKELTGKSITAFNDFDWDDVPKGAWSLYCHALYDRHLRDDLLQNPFVPGLFDKACQVAEAEFEAKGDPRVPKRGQGMGFADAIARQKHPAKVKREEAVAKKEDRLIDAYSERVQARGREILGEVLEIQRKEILEHPNQDELWQRAWPVMAVLDMADILDARLAQQQAFTPGPTRH